MPFMLCLGNIDPSPPKKYLIESLKTRTSHLPFIYFVYNHVVELDHHCVECASVLDKLLSQRMFSRDSVT